MKALLRIVFCLAALAVHAGEPEISGLARPEVRQALSKLLSIQCDGPLLKFRRTVWDEPFEINVKNPEELAETNRLVDAISPRVVFIAARLARCSGAINKGYRVRNEKDCCDAYFRTDELAVSAEVGEKVVDISIEDAASHAVLSMREDSRGLIIRLEDAKTLICALQQPAGNFGDGEFVLSTLDRTTKKRTTVDAASFEEFLKQNTELAQLKLLRPLADLGVSIAPGKYLPTVMAVACGGFSPAAPALAKQADDLIAKLGSDDQDMREIATQELIRLYPRAIYSVVEAQKKAKDQEVVARLDRVIAAHPGIIRARDYVEREKLHENREYLKDILANVPFFKAAARARLAALYGKDYGDEVKDWPKE